MTARRVGDHVEIEPEQVRAGQRGRHVRNILIISTVLVVGGFAVVALLSYFT